MLIDSHAHIDFKDFPTEEVAALLKRAKENKVDRIIHIGSGEGLESFRRAIPFAESFENLFTTLGIHPHDASLATSESLQEIASLCTHPKVLAIGEVGLDFHYNHSPQEIQIKVLRDFIRLAKTIKKPLVIHTRNADKRLHQILIEENASEVGGVIHCFSSNLSFAEKMLKENFYISFSGIVTFKKSVDVQETASKIPLERMLIETDCPYLAPVPYRGKRNEPSYLLFTAEKIAQLRGISLETLARITTKNTEDVFKMKSQ